MLDVLGGTIGDIFLWSVVIAITVCCLAVHTAAIRMMFAMARDNNLPAGEHLATGATRGPRRRSSPPILIGVLAILILVVNIRQPQIFVVITSIGIVMIYIAYLLVTVPMLLARLRGEWRSEDAPPGYFSLGRWGLPVNVLAVTWGLCMALNLIWPRQSIYNAVEPFHWYLKWGAVLFIGVDHGRRLRLLLVRAAPQDRDAGQPRVRRRRAGGRARRPAGGGQAGVTRRRAPRPRTGGARGGSSRAAARRAAPTPAPGVAPLSDEPRSWR